MCKIYSGCCMNMPKMKCSKNVVQLNGMAQNRAEKRRHVLCQKGWQDDTNGENEKRFKSYPSSFIGNGFNSNFYPRKREFLCTTAQPKGRLLVMSTFKWWRLQFFKFRWVKQMDTERERKENLFWYLRLFNFDLQSKIFEEKTCRSVKMLHGAFLH